MVFGAADAWGPGGKYAVNCPDKCNPAQCGSTQRCRRTVLDDCGCCPVCAAGRGEHCYRTVSGMHGVKCGPGLFCDFYKDEDDYGDEYGICKGTVCCVHLLRQMGLCMGNSHIQSNDFVISYVFSINTTEVKIKCNFQSKRTFKNNFNYGDMKTEKNSELLLFSNQRDESQIISLYKAIY